MNHSSFILRRKDSWEEERGTFISYELSKIKNGYIDKCMNGCIYIYAYLCLSCIA